MTEEELIPFVGKRVKVTFKGNRPYMLGVLQFSEHDGAFGLESKAYGCLSTLIPLFSVDGIEKVEERN